MSAQKVQLAVPTVIAIMAAVVVLRSFNGSAEPAYAAVEVVSDPTPYSADHGKASRTATPEEQPATF